MPTLVDLRNRLTKDRETLPNVSNAEEALVADVRGRLTPAQVVEQKLRSMLAGTKTPRADSLALASRRPAGE